MKTLIDSAHTGIDTILHDDGEKLAIERVADVQPVLDEIKRIKDCTDGKSKSGDLYHAGSIPGIEIEKYCNKHGVDFYTFINEDIHIVRMLNDPDFAALRIWGGRL